MASDLINPNTDREERLQSHRNLSTPTVSNQNFKEAKGVLDPRDDPTTDVLNGMSNIQQQQQEQIKMMYDIQGKRDDHLQQVLTCHREMTASMSLPDVEAPIFDGRPTEYCHFVRAFENLIESRTFNQQSKLFYLVQYTSGEVKDLMRSCPTVKPEEGYIEARRLLKEKYGQNYRIATVFVNCMTEATPIKSEDGVALQTFSVLLVSCRNTLKEIGYLNKFENPDCLIKIIEKLPFSLPQRWRERADCITNKEKRDISFDDVVKFVEERVRVMNHPIFSKLTTSKSKDGREPKGRCAFGIDANSGYQSRQREDSKVKLKVHKCPMCSGNHILLRCNRFQRESVESVQSCARKIVFAR